MSLADIIVENTSIIVDGKKLKVLGKAFYTTQKDPDAKYYKFLLEGHYVLVVVPDEIAYFGKNFGLIKEFEFFPSSVSYQGKTYRQINNDNQVRLELLFGSPSEVEGDVEFWDYESGDGDIISLAVLENSTKRADVVAKYYKLNEITVE